MAKTKGLNNHQADILASALDTGLYQGERIPWSVIHVPATWGSNIAALKRRGYLRERRHNMFDVTPEGEAAYRAWLAS